MKVVFTTLFLALVVGTQTVKVEIEGLHPLHHIEVRGEARVERAADHSPM